MRACDAQHSVNVAYSLDPCQGSANTAMGIVDVYRFIARYFNPFLGRFDLIDVGHQGILYYIEVDD